MARVVTNTVVVRGVRIAYEEWGEGRPVVLVHGMGSWRRTWPQFRDAGYHFYSLDLPGFGDSALPKRRQRLEDYAATLVAAVAALAPSEPPLMVGHSFGCMVITRAAALGLADKAAAALLVSPAGFLEPRGVMMPTPFYTLNRLLIWITGSNWYGPRMVVALGADPARLSPAERQDLQQGWRKAREMARMGRFYSYPTMAQDLERSGWPHLILAGDRDPLFPAAVWREALAHLTVTWLPGQGHVPFLQDPERFQEYWRAALDRLYPAGAPA